MRQFIQRGWLLALFAFAGFIMFFPSRSAANQESSHLIYRQLTCRKYAVGNPAIPRQARKARNHPGAQEARGPDGVRWKSSPKGLVEISRSGKTKIWTPQQGLPMLPITSLAVGPEGWVWMGTPDGAICFRPSARKGQRWFYFWGRRYLKDNTVVNVAAAPHRAWIETRTGTSLIDFKKYTLEEKSAYIIKNLQRCDDRYGLVADALLLRPGVLSSCKPVSNDNDGLWTSMYIAAACFRYAATQSPGALRNAQHSLNGLFRLTWITGVPGYTARSFIHRGEGGDNGGMWFWGPDGNWKWKGDTSSDELVGHFFVYGIAYDLLPPKDEWYREAIRNNAVNIANNLQQHGWDLAGHNGRITYWGRFSPAYFKTPRGHEDQSLNALELLAFLRVAYHVSGNQTFLNDYHRLINKDGYNRLITEGFAHLPPLTHFNFSDEELAYLSFYSLMKYERNPALRKQYQTAMSDLWHHDKAEHNPLWDYIYEMGTGARDYDAQGALNTLERIPLDMIYWTAHNSQRLDLNLTRQLNEDGHRQSLTQIPPDEHCTTKWNGNPFGLDCKAGGRRIDDGTFYLLPYWLGRYNKLLPQ